MSIRPQLSDEMYGRLVEAAAEAFDEDEEVTRDRPAGELLEAVLDDRQKAMEAALGWKQKAEQLEARTERTQ